MILCVCAVCVCVCVICVCVGKNHLFLFPHFFPSSFLQKTLKECLLTSANLRLGDSQVYKDTVSSTTDAPGIINGEAIPSSASATAGDGGENRYSMEPAGRASDGVEEVLDETWDTAESPNFAAALQVMKEEKQAIEIDSDSCFGWSIPFEMYLQNFFVMLLVYYFFLMTPVKISLW